MRISHPMTRALALLLGVASGFVVAAGDASAQGSGQIHGRVVDLESGRPLRGVELSVEGTSIRTRTDGRGRYRLARVPAGPAEVRVAFSGFATIRETWEVRPGVAIEIEFELVPFAGVLEGLTADAPRPVPVRTAPDGVVRIERAEIEASTAGSVAELLRGVPGLSIQGASGQIGGGGQLRIRGMKSMSLSNTPVLVVDGVRVHASAAGRRESVLQVLHDMPLSMVRRIEVLRGPAAAAAYGPDTAAGVILVFTGRNARGRR